MSQKKVPPYSNRGAQNTSENRCNVLVDWVSATFKNIEKYDLVDALGMDKDDFLELDYGSFGYRRSIGNNHIKIFYDGRHDMGIHLQMTGQGCREYENCKGFISWEIAFIKMIDLGCNCTRLDLAIDDYNGGFSIKQIERKIKAGEVVSRFKDATNYEKVRLRDGYVKGQTLYFGSSSSRVMVRFYDKLAERINKGEVLDDDIESWIRVELELRKERAHKAMSLIAFEEMAAGAVGMGVLKEYIRFLKRGKDTNKSRWKTAPFWEKFLKNVEPLRITEKPVSKTIEDKINWLERQVAPSLKTVAEAESLDFVIHMIDQALDRLKESDLIMIDQYKNEKKRLQEAARVKFMRSIGCTAEQIDNYKPVYRDSII